MQALRKFFAPLPEHDDNDGREMWPSRAGFLLAAIGSSVGLGNIWRFPALAFKYGGLAFFIPYLLALFLIGIPLLALELSLGQLFRSGDVVCFSRISHRLRGLGLSSVFGSLVVTSYYCVLLAWIVIYFIKSFQTVLPWTQKDANAYFFEDIVHQPASGYVTSTPEMISGATFGALLFTWVLVYFCIWRGVGLTGKIAYVTMTLPVVFIVVLFIRSATLPGATDGMLDYIGKFDGSMLSNPLMWSEATGQIFFSIGIAFGTMTCYGSYNSKFQNTAVDSVIIAVSNSVYEIFCGFVVFAIVGYMRFISGRHDVAAGGYELAFSTYPVAFSSLPGASFWCAFFFLTLFILGLDSGFSMIEGGATVVLDSRRFSGASRQLVVGLLCAASFLVGTLYCTESGLKAMDAVDYFVNNIGIVSVGFMECFGPSFLYRFDESAAVVGRVPVMIFNSMYLLGLLVCTVVSSTSNAIIGAAVGLGLILFGLAWAVAMSNSILALHTRIRVITIGQIEMLRHDINNVIAIGKEKTGLPLLWSLCIKFVCIPVLLFVLAIPFQQMATTENSLPVEFRWLGITVGTIAIAIMVVGMIMPDWFVWLLPANEEFAEEVSKKFVHDREVTAEGSSMEMSATTLA